MNKILKIFWIKKEPLQRLSFEEEEEADDDDDNNEEEDEEKSQKISKKLIS